MCAVLVLVAALAYRGWRSHVLHEFAVSSGANLSNLLPKAAAADVARGFPPAFGATSAEEAGYQFHHLVMWRPTDPSAAALLLPYDTARPSRMRALPDSNPLHLRPALWCDSIVPLAAKGLAADQRRFLDSVSDDPDLRTFILIGKSREMDVIGARFSFAPAPEFLFMRMLPIAYPSPVKRASQLACANAAVRFSRGDAVGAEAMLRATAHAGLLLLDNGSNTIDVALGAVVTRQALTAIAALYNATGRSLEAAKIMRDIKDAAAKPFPANVARQGHDVEALRDDLPAISASPDVPPGMKWEYLIQVETYDRTAYCMGRFSFGDEYSAWLATVRPSMVKRGSDSAFFAWITAPPKSKAGCGGRSSDSSEHAPKVEAVAP
jgi:hypothetical protein